MDIVSQQGFATGITLLDQLGADDFCVQEMLGQTVVDCLFEIVQLTLANLGFAGWGWPLALEGSAEGFGTAVQFMSNILDMAATAAHFLYHHPALSVAHGRCPVVWSLQVSARLIEGTS